MLLIDAGEAPRELHSQEVDHVADDKLLVDVTAYFDTVISNSAASGSGVLHLSEFWLLFNLSNQKGTYNLLQLYSYLYLYFSLQEPTCQATY